MLPTKFSPLTAFRIGYVSCTSALPLQSSVPMDRSPTAGFARFSTFSEYTLPMIANCTSHAGWQSMFAPASKSRSGRSGARVGRTIAMAGRFTPGMRPRLTIALVATAPELPADTKTSARFSFTRRIATLMEQSFLRRTASTGTSSISISSVAGTISSNPFSVARWKSALRSFEKAATTFWIAARLPTRRILTFSRPQAASIAPTTICLGA